MPPLYTYYCPSCGKTEDALVSVENRDAIEHAPRCPASPVHPLRARVVMLRQAVNTVHGVVRNPAVPRRSRGMGY